MNRSLGLFGSILLTFYFLIARPGCNLDLENPVSVRDYYPPAAEYTPITEPAIQNGQTYHQSNTSHAPSTIIVGSFNIQTFGPSKASKPPVMEKLVDIARRFDLLAIQEIRDQEQTVLHQLVSQINADGSRYGYIVGMRQGYTFSKEQYAYIFDLSKLRLTSNPYDSPNPNNALHRPPLVASFECTQAPPGQGFSFTVVNVHTDPDVVQEEFQAFDYLLPAIRANHPEEDDFIFLGDFNDSEKRIQRHRWLDNQLPLVRSTWSTKVRSGRSLDNIVIDGMRTAEYRNQSGVMDLKLHYSLNDQQALQISDHYPVWAVFSTVEYQERMVNTPITPAARR